MSCRLPHLAGLVFAIERYFCRLANTISKVCARGFSLLLPPVRLSGKLNLLLCLQPDPPEKGAF